jgi:hypothetical protein
MKVISFKNTILFKRGIWLSAAALIACVAMPSVLDGSLWLHPQPVLFAMCILGGFEAYFLKKTQIYRLVDEVVDCGDHLEVRRGRTEEIIPFSNVSTADVLSGGGIHRISVNLRESTKLGAQIDFLPQAILWSNLPAIKSVAGSLTDRANHANHAKYAPVAQ